MSENSKISLIKLSARTAEVIQIRAPIKRHIRHLDSQFKRIFPKLLNGIVRRLRKNGYKLIHVSKAYRKGGIARSDSFWKKETVEENINIVWFCTLTPIFERGFRFQVDLDLWFEFPKILENLRAELYEAGYPHTSRKYALEFSKEEATRILGGVEESLQQKIRTRVRGWGDHGIPKDVADRSSQKICHRRVFSLDSIPELVELGKTLRKVEGEGTNLAEDMAEKIGNVAREKLKSSFPFQIDPMSIEGFLAFFLWIRKPGGGFEYQLYRFVHENYGKEILRDSDIRDALLRLELHGYVNVRKTPSKLRKKLERNKISRCRRFYLLGPMDVSGRKLSDRLGDKVNVGAYLAPLPRHRLINSLDFPDHLISKSIKELVRRDVISERKVLDCRGRTVWKIKSKRRRRGLTKLEGKIVSEARRHYDVQKKALDRMQEGI